ncbi:Uma2 family endonuclease [Geminisphaera colitermitum]|uniref:Uma2 family endonuclease n=1 Tax=Geminisphaera colitermitum TaxID=1148786 RepID=UPI000158E001|nr:Uma2 family endonuclease [Geminisphaera colitermitum]
MPVAAYRPLTAHDYRELPEYGPRYQLIEGDLHMAPAPNRFHQGILIFLAGEFTIYLKQNQIGKVYAGPFDVYLSDLNVYQPDLSYFSKERYCYLTDEGANGAPDLVVEILSPSTSKYDLGVKRDVYARTGVLEYWIIDPMARVVKVYNLEENADTPVATLRSGRKLASALLPGLSIGVTELFNAS